MAGGDHLEIVLALEELPQPVQDDLVIVDEDDANAHERWLILVMVSSIRPSECPAQSEPDGARGLDGRG